jgi:hypothetical protein
LLLNGILARGGFISPNKAFIFFGLKIVSPEIPPKVPPPKRCYREFGPMLASAQLPPEFSHGAPMGCQRINSLALVGSEPGNGDNLPRLVGKTGPSVPEVPHLFIAQQPRNQIHDRKM